jgi:RIO-like serine/threonine protein kinase
MTPENDTRIERRDPFRALLRGDVALDAVLQALRAPRETLKLSRKTWTYRVGGWVVKESRLQAGLGALKHTLLRNRYRRSWLAANHLFSRGVLVPAPIAYVEEARFGIVLRNALVCEYLNGFRNVEQHARDLAQRNAAPETVRAFFDGLADAVNHLCSTGAYHSDLSGKNIFTKDGASFYFIDLDGVVVNGPHTDERRKRNHVQLYDSFCDWFDEEILAAFIRRMLPAGHPTTDWVSKVREAQRARRARIEAVRRKQGRK